MGNGEEGFQDFLLVVNSPFLQIKKAIAPVSPCGMNFFCLKVRPKIKQMV
jgi:hypothetical protein